MQLYTVTVTSTNHVIWQNPLRLSKGIELFESFCSLCTHLKTLPWLFLNKKVWSRLKGKNQKSAKSLMFFRGLFIEGTVDLFG